MAMQVINISNDNVVDKCDLKCSYNFKYSDSNTTAKNEGVMISLTYDNDSSPQVTYNNQKFNVTKVYITSPSIHTFNGSPTDAELCIEHAPVKGGPLLSVGIPIKSSGDSSTATFLLTEIIKGVATNAPSQGDSTNLNINNFSLQQIVPNKPFYSYTDSNNNMDWIMFGVLDAIPMDGATLTTLGEIIKPFTLPMMGGGLFKNSTGPNRVTIGDGIYIKCNPTGESSETTGVEYAKNAPSFDLSKLIESPVTRIIIQLIISSILFLVIFLGLNYFYKMSISDSPKLPQIPKIF